MSKPVFSENAIHSANSFRSIMSALARPGRILPFAPVLEVSPPLWSTAAAIAVTLCDFQTPVWLAPEFRDDAITQFIRFHTGAPIADQPQDAAFVFLAAEDATCHLSLFARGTHEYPDRSATLVIQTASLGNAGPAKLFGPGIKTSMNFGAQGVGPGFWDAMAENHALFPLGFDVIFVSRSAVAALPRSTAICLMESV